MEEENITLHERGGKSTSTHMGIRKAHQANWNAPISREAGGSADFQVAETLGLQRCNRRDARRHEFDVRLVPRQ